MRILLIVVVLAAFGLLMWVRATNFGFKQGQQLRRRMDRHHH